MVSQLLAYKWARIPYIWPLDVFDKTVERINLSSDPSKFATRYLKSCNKYGNFIWAILSLCDFKSGERYRAAKYILNKHKEESEKLRK